MSIMNLNGLPGRDNLTKSLSMSLKRKQSEIAFSDDIKTLNGVSAIHHVQTNMTWLIPDLTGERLVAFTPPTIRTDKQLIDLTQFNIDRGNFHQQPQYDFSIGFNLVNGLETVVFEGVEYRWAGGFNKDVPANSTPESSGGEASDKWINVGSAGLSKSIINGSGELIGIGGDKTLDEFIAKDDYRRVFSVRGYGVVADDISPINDLIGEGGTPIILNVPEGIFHGGVLLKYNFGLSGCSQSATELVTQKDSSGIEVSGDDFRDSIISNFSISVGGTVAGSPPNGTGIGFNVTASKMVNCELKNLSFNFFDIGFKSGAADFSNFYSNIRANNNRVSFNISSNGQIIENTYIGFYAANFTELALLLRGVKGSTWLNFNMGHNASPGAYFHHIDNNSTGVVFESPNFEMDVAGKISAQQSILVASASEVTYNSPHFNKINPDSDTYVHFRCRANSITHINNPVVLNDDGTAWHISVEDNAIVYLNDPRKVFTKFKVVGNGKIIRVNDKTINAPDFTTRLKIKPGMFVTTGFLAQHVIIEPDFHEGLVPEQFKYKFYADTFQTTGFNFRIIDTTTGNMVTSSDVEVSISVIAWR